jgi:hypothetical protein
MRSESRLARLAELLRSQGLGVLVGQAVVLLLAVGSLVISATRGGASKDVALDDLAVFFRVPSWTHAWLYLLVVAFGLYGVNTALATWHAAARRVRAGIRRPAAYAATVVHVGFLVALLAHLVGGFGGAERGVVLLGPGPTDLGDGRSARLVSLAIDRLPNRAVKEVRARVEGTGPDGPFAAVVGYNRPLSFGLGSDLYLLLQPLEARNAIVLRHRHAPGNPWALASAALLAVGLALMWRRFLPASRRADLDPAADLDGPDDLERAA